MSSLFLLFTIQKMPRGNSFEKLGPAVAAVHRLVRVVCATSARSFPPPSFVACEGVNVPVALWLASSFELFVPPPRAPSHPRRSLQAMGVAVSDALWLDHDLLWLVYEGVGEGEV